MPRVAEIHQIAYSRETLAGIGQGFLPLDNLANPRPDWREYHVIRQYLLGQGFLNNGIASDKLLGFFSPRFTEKTGLTHAQVQAFIQAAPDETEVFTFSPQPDMGAFFLNVFEQNELYDPGFIAASQQFLQHVGMTIDLASMLMDSRHIVFSNYFVASGSFWHKWLQLAEQVYAVCEGEDGPLKTLLTTVTSYQQVQRKVFLLERLASLLLVSEEWQVQAYNTFDCAWSGSRLNQFSHEAVLSDALKIAMREQGYSQYWAAYAKVRDVLRQGDGQGLPRFAADDWARLADTATQWVAEARVTDAVNVCQTWLMQYHSPYAYVVCFNLGVALSNHDALDEAERSYRQAIGFKPDFLPTYLNLGTLLERMGRKEEALGQWCFVLRLADTSQQEQQEHVVMALNNLGRLLEIMRRFDEAEGMIARSLEIDPDQPAALQHWIHLRQKQCKWPVYQPFPGVDDVAMAAATSPLALLSASNDPQVQLAAARRFAETRVNLDVSRLSNIRGYGHSKLRIGYLSSDFCLHPVALLTAEMFELHDRERFEIYGFCWSPEDDSAVRQRVVQAIDHFVRIDGMSDEQAARCIREHEIDILVDLHGLTSGSRPDVLAYRPAPVQVTYLGFPGTTGLPCIDFVLADRYVLPASLAAHFSEKPLYLPRVFQVSDRGRDVGVMPSRVACGLPESGIVFCSFNNNYKFTPEMFAVWMRILHRVPDSVLWLLADNPWAQENLLAAAEAHGMGRERLVFATRVSPADYLARYPLADIFLDTFPFNAGTTANDALWMGVPIVTCSGETFASRMAGSLLHAVDLPDLVTESLFAYEDCAVRLAQQRELLQEIKQQLSHAREQSALFDVPTIVRAIESQYMQIAPK